MSGLTDQISGVGDIIGSAIPGGSILTDAISSITGLFSTGGLFGPGGDDPATYQAYLDSINGTGYWGNKRSAYFSSKDNSRSSLDGHLQTLKNEFVDLNTSELTGC